MKHLIKNYVYVGSIVVTAVVTFNAVEDLLNNLYEPEKNFDTAKAKKIVTAHRLIASFCAINNASAIGDAVGSLLYTK